MSKHARSETVSAEDRYAIPRVCENCEGWTTIFNGDGKLVPCPDHWAGDEEHGEPDAD